MQDTLWPDITLFGCGNMGGALRQGWLTHGLPAERLTTITRSNTQPLAPNRHGLPHVIVLAIKPGQLAEATPAIRAYADAGCLLISVMASVPLARLRACFPEVAVILRAMPNMAAAVGESATAVCAETGLSPFMQNLAERLLRPVGSVHWLGHEAQLAPATALAGSGPAYFYYFIDMLAASAAALGLPGDLARTLARQTMVGSAHLLDTSGKTPEALRIAVTSPGGTTAAAMSVLREGLGPLCDAALAAASVRAGP